MSKIILAVLLFTLYCWRSNCACRNDIVQIHYTEVPAFFFSYALSQCDVVSISLHIWVNVLAYLSVGWSLCLCVCGQMDVGVCRLVSQLQWQTSLIPTPGEALIQAPPGNYSSREPSHSQKEKGTSTEQRALGFATKINGLFECVSLLLECQPLPLSIRLCVWMGHTQTGTSTHTHTWKRASVRPGRPDRHLTLEPIPPPYQSPTPIPCFPHWPLHPAHPASFVSHKCSSLEAGWFHRVP